ncbi:RNA-directed DNA polymerase, eukaryota, reverse transcriptase zinc-binding domain protein [Tanacetum coccineum]
MMQLVSITFGIHGFSRKVNIFGWRASLNRLPTRSNLSHRVVVLSSSCCLMCESAIEEIDHCLIRCPMLNQIWRKVWSWWSLDMRVYCSLWAIWKWRNKIVNAMPKEIAHVKDEDIFPSIQRLAKVWIEGRSKSHEAHWSCWIARPFDILKNM